MAAGLADVAGASGARATAAIPETSTGDATTQPAPSDTVVERLKVPQRHSTKPAQSGDMLPGEPIETLATRPLQVPTKYVASGTTRAPLRRVLRRSEEDDKWASKLSRTR